MLGCPIHCGCRERADGRAGAGAGAERAERSQAARGPPRALHRPTRCYDLYALPRQTPAAGAESTLI